MKKVLISLLALLFITGCTKEQVQLDVAKTSEEHNPSNHKFEDVEKRLEEAENRLAQLENLSVAQCELINTNSKQLKQAHHLVNNIPGLEIKRGYITDFDSQETLQVQLINYLDDPDAPNGFRLEMADIVQFKLGHKVLIYYELGTREVSLDDFLSHKEDHRLYDIYSINGEIVMLAEMYIP